MVTSKLVSLKKRGGELGGGVECRPGFRFELEGMVEESVFSHSTGAMETKSEKVGVSLMHETV